MKTKYKMINGFAFSEEKDLVMLKQMAAKGWLLEGITTPFFFKFRKGEPRELEYSLDYRSNPDQEYFDMFAIANWQHVCSVGDEVHIFAAPPGTKPIYTDKDALLDKYETQKRQMGKGALYSFPALVVSFILLTWFRNTPNLELFFLIAMLVCWIIFIFFFLPYLGFAYRAKKLRN